MKMTNGIAFKMAIPEDILKIQKKLSSFEKGSRNYNKYLKILKKHTKSYTMKKRVSSHIETIEVVNSLAKEESKGTS